MMKANLKKTLGQMASAALLLMFAGAALAQSATAEGEIRKVDLKAQRVVIKHGEWKGMSMGPMTMAFQVRDGIKLADLKKSHLVRFTVEKDGNEFILTAIEPAGPAATDAAAATQLHAQAHDHAHSHGHGHTDESRR